jgi:hypothetical protein
MCVIVREDMKIRQYCAALASIPFGLFVVVSPALADKSPFEGLRESEAAVVEQRRDLAKAERELWEERREGDRKGIKKAQQWVESERRDLQEALSDVRYWQSQLHYRADGRGYYPKPVVYHPGNYQYNPRPYYPKPRNQPRPKIYNGNNWNNGPRWNSGSYGNNGGGWINSNHHDHRNCNGNHW